MEVPMARQPRFIEDVNPEAVSHLIITTCNHDKLHQPFHLDANKN